MAKKKTTQEATQEIVSILYEHHMQADGSFKIYDKKNYRYVVEEQVDYQFYLNNGGICDIVEYEAPVEQTIYDLVGIKLHELANARWQAVTSGIKYNNITIDTSVDSQTYIIGAAYTALKNPDYVCKWKTKEGFVTLTAPEILGIADILRAHIQSCFDKEAELQVALRSLTTKEEIENFSWASLNNTGK